MPRLAFHAAALRVQAPATSANLGPGFDALGLALSLYDDVVVRVTDEPGLTVDVAGSGAATVPRNGRHLVVRSMRAAFAELGGAPRGLDVVCANRIPHGRGLGSSAAAIVSGVLAARALVVGGTERMTAADVLRLAARLEGHADNVAACLLGGVTVAVESSGDEPGVAAMQVPVSTDIAPVALVPGSRSSTKSTRRMLPETVPHRDAVANAGRSALLVAALASRPDLLMAATEDRLHQAYREPAMPTSAALVAALRDVGVPAVVSGAGPTVLALATTATRHLPHAFARRGWTVLDLDIDREGARIVPVG